LSVSPKLEPARAYAKKLRDSKDAGAFVVHVQQERTEMQEDKAKCGGFEMDVETYSEVSFIYLMEFLSQLLDA
jgi:hypothetical protein